MALVAGQKLLLSSFRWLLPLPQTSYPTTTHPPEHICIATPLASLPHLQRSSCIVPTIVASCTTQTHPPPCNCRAVSSLVASATTNSAFTALVSRPKLFAPSIVINGRSLLTSAASSGNFRHSSSYPEEGSAYPQQYPSINSCYCSHQLPSNYRQR